MSSAPRQRAPRTGNITSRSSSVSEKEENYEKSAPLNRGRRYKYPKRRSLPVSVVTGFSLLLVVLFAVFQRLWYALIIHKIPSWGLRAKHLSPENFASPRVARKPAPILTAYLEPLDSLPSDLHKPRRTSADRLKKFEYPRVKQCSRLFETWPIDDFPAEDPYLPWIHDVFPSDGKYVQFVAQNKRRCDTGDKMTDVMKHWEPQMALFQPVPVKRNYTDGTYRLSSPTEATAKETRLLCRFHDADNNEYTTLSEFPFNYEYVSWRKSKNSMFDTKGKDSAQFWLSQLLFSCPIPQPLQSRIQAGRQVDNDESQLWLDLIPIRTPARNGQFLFTQDHVGADTLRSLSPVLFNATAAWGDSHVLPAPRDSGRWANIPICLAPLQQSQSPVQENKKNRLVACTWTAASYTRRGDAVTMGDTAARLREWIAFHLLVGFEKIYVYDNTAPGTPSPLQAIAEHFPDQVTYHRWPCQVCNNNRPNNANPGERSSQYAAEASCRQRYGPSTDWMAFMDTDEYMVPKMSDTWQSVLDKMEKREMQILKMRSSRTKPRVSLMEVSEDQSNCFEGDPTKEDVRKESCIVPRKNETFLKVYNCEFIKPPRPTRFERAMKQIYRPAHVFSHFVHYSTVTVGVSRLYKDFLPNETYIKYVHDRAWKDSQPEVFLDEIKEGMLVHTKSVLPHETMHRTTDCELNSKYNCAMGFPCPDHVEFSDELHQNNAFKDDDGKYCNCWLNSKVEDVFVPKLEAYLSNMDKP